MSTPKAQGRGYQRSWKNLLINKEYQLRFTFLMVALAAILLAGLGYWVQSVAEEATTVGISTDRGETCPKVPEPLAVQMPDEAEAPSNAGPSNRQNDEVIGTPNPSEATRRSRVVIDESSIKMIMTLPADFADRVAAHGLVRFDKPLTLMKSSAVKQDSLLMVLASVILIIGLGIYGIATTHKVAGPLFKVSLYLNKMRDGRFDKVWNLRKGDQLVDFYEHFKAGHAGIVTLQREDIVALQAFIAAADELHQTTPLAPDQLAAVDELRALVAKKEKSLE